MQGEAKIQRIRKQEVFKLITKIRRLKNKLLSYGMTGKEAIDIILYEFLKAPRIDWTLPHNTVIFYQIQNKYHTDHNTAELILLLEAIVPDWQTRTVVQYLHQTLSYNALSFGIDLDISDDSSNQDGHDMSLLLIKAKKKNSMFGLKAKKRNHLSNSSNNRFDSPQSLEFSEAENRKKIHFNEKIEDFKVDRKQTEENVDLDFGESEEHLMFSSTNENMMVYTNQQKGNDLLKMKRQLLQENEEKPKRKQPVELEILQEEKLEKKIKK